MGVKVREKPKGSGIWWVFVDHQGKRKAKKIGTDKKLADDVARKIGARLTLGDLDLSKPEEERVPTFREYAALWLEGYVKPLMKPATYQRYEVILRKYLNPAIGSMLVTEIKRADIRALLLKLHRQGQSRSSICLARDVISGPMNQAVDDELIPANPAKGLLKRMKIERDRRSAMDPFNSDEVILFLETCSVKYPDWYPFFLAAFRTGMRMGELLGLKWGDIDFNGRFIHVQRSFKLGKFTTPKNGKTRRVDMSDMLGETLKALQVERRREALREGREVVEFVFHRNEQPISQNSLRNVFKRILARGGLREIRFHDIRHTFASLLLNNGESPVYVKDQLGHHSIQMTVDIYGHLIPGANRGAVNKLDTQPAATYPQPAQNENAQSLGIARLS